MCYQPHGRDSGTEKVARTQLWEAFGPAEKAANALSEQGTEWHSVPLIRKIQEVPASCMRAVWTGPGVLGAWVLGVSWGRALFDSETRAKHSSSPSVKNARQLPVPLQLRGTHPEPSERGILFSSLLSDTDSHAGKRKHLLSDAAATSSSEVSSRSFALQNEGAEAGCRTACALGPGLSPPPPRAPDGRPWPGREQAALWVTGDFL